MPSQKLRPARRPDAKWGDEDDMRTMRCGEKKSAETEGVARREADEIGPKTIHCLFCASELSALAPTGVIQCRDCLTFYAIAKNLDGCIDSLEVMICGEKCTCARKR